METATLGGGCFWCLEAAFIELKGVEKVESGYAGGNLQNPSYWDVCTGETGHAEVVQVTFDPKIITYKQLLQIFFTIHDPTTLNRQGNDTGSEYRSIIFYDNDEQKKVAQQVIKEVNDSKIWGKPAVTELKPLTKFYKAEDEHQNYFKKNPLQPYCIFIVRPKVAKFRKLYFDMLKKQ